MAELLLRDMYLAGMDGDTTTYINNRLTNRITYLDWDRNLMGPIRDEIGLEQGGSNSSEYYKLYSNEHLISAQSSAQGVDLGNGQVISAVGLADDSVIASNKLSNLANILHLTNNYCQKYQVSLSHSKTKLLRMTNIDKDELEVFNPIVIKGKHIEFTNEAEHVGIIRSVEGNLPHILNRMTAHRKALNATKSSGVARKSRANPCVGLHLEKMYATPVLMSGLSSLVLSASEMSILDNDHKNTYQNIQKLLPKTPRCVVYFLGGSLPAQAIVHLRMLTIFGMVTRLRGNPLNIHARNILITAKTTSKSWFCQLRDICLKYQLPNPLSILENPPQKESFKRLIKSHVVDYWEQTLRGEASLLPSIPNFKPEFMSLKKPHPIWATAGSSTYEVSKAIQQARFLSGRYRSESLMKHWNNKNKQGYCTAQLQRVLT